MLKIVAAVGLAVIAAIAGFATWEASAKRDEHRAISALVAEGAGGLAQALKQPAPEQAAKLEAALASLHGLNARRHRPYAEAADVYLVSARAVAQRQADAARLGQEARQARAALEAHLRGPRGRSDAWIRQAAELSRRADQAHADHVRSQEALIEVLRTLPEAQKPLEAYAGAAALADPALQEAALGQAQEVLKRARQEAEAARRPR